MTKKAVVLFSGGLDSTTCLAIAKNSGYDCYALSFNYSQRHVIELQAAKEIAAQMQVIEHRIVNLDLGQFGGSALTDNKINVPDYSGSADIPITYVPARNTIFLSIALGFAEVIGAYDLFIGVNAIDYSGYPDCRPEFIQAFQTMANLGTKSGVLGEKFVIQTPLLHLSKAEIIQVGHTLGVDYSMTKSCYALHAEGLACGSCDSCVLRKQGFVASGVPDPTLYIKGSQ
jgi:7-cyano-7-deazaguanine synthase